MLHLIDPGVSVEADGKADGEEDTSVPVDQDDNLDDNFGYPESIWKVCPGLGLVEELEHPVNPRNPVQSEDDWAGNLFRAFALEEEVGKVCRQDADDVDLEKLALPVVLPQHGRLLHHDALVEVALVHPHQQVQQVDCITNIIDQKPTLRSDKLVVFSETPLILTLGKRLSSSQKTLRPITKKRLYMTAKLITISQ